MRKLPLVKYISQQVADQLGEDGEYLSGTRTIQIRHGMDKLYELQVFIHEQLHFIQHNYKGYIKAMDDNEDITKNETDLTAKKIMKLLLQERFKKQIKNL